MIRSSTIPQHIKSAPLQRGALFVCLPKDSPTRHELLSRIVNPERRKKRRQSRYHISLPRMGKGDRVSDGQGAFVSSTNAPLFPCTTSCLSYHSHPIRPCGAPSPTGEGCDTRIPSSKKAAKPPPYNKAPSTSVGMTGGRRVISHSLSHRCVDPSCAFGAPLL